MTDETESTEQKAQSSKETALGIALLAVLGLGSVALVKGTKWLLGSGKGRPLPERLRGPSPEESEREANKFATSPNFATSAERERAAVQVASGTRTALAARRIAQERVRLEKVEDAHRKQDQRNTERYWGHR
jgi:hypothetical protein